MAFHESDLVKGSLDLLVLRILKQGPRHGYSIAKRIQFMSDEVLKIQYGSLYPALQRLERRGQIQSKWGMSETNRRVRFYQLTADGRKQMTNELKNWEQFVEAMSLVLKEA